MITNHGLALARTNYTTLECPKQWVYVCSERTHLWQLDQVVAAVGTFGIEFFRLGLPTIEKLFEGMYARAFAAAS